MMEITADNLSNGFRVRGFYYSNDLIFNYFISLMAKPFVILTGISGSGKSKIAEIFSEILSPKGKKLHELIPVKPNWRDSRGLFGYHNLIDGSYYITPLIRLFIRAVYDPENPYFLILDEMNIAKTEHYFADYLSLLESRRCVKIEDIADLENIREAPELPKETSLSEAIILSGLDINRSDEFLDIKEYRENIFSRLWHDQIFGGQNWTAQYRSELNQGDGRLAFRVFEGAPGGGKYKFRDRSKVGSEDLATIDRLKVLHRELSVKLIKVRQENIILHNSEKCLAADNVYNCDDMKCALKASEKYKCPKLYDENVGRYLVPPQIPIPLNVFTIGTVNVDETTYMFSPKVLDRSNVIEFNNVDFVNLYQLQNEAREILRGSNNYYSDEGFYFNNDSKIPALRISIACSRHANKFAELAKEQFYDLLKIFSVLRRYNLHFGYRVMNEISLYMCSVNKNTEYQKKNEVALDFQISQKILPKIYGQYDKVWAPLVGILNISLKHSVEWDDDTDSESLIAKLGALLPAENINTLHLNQEQSMQIFRYPRTASKILSMLSDLDSTGFATFIR